MLATQIRQPIFTTTFVRFRAVLVAACLLGPASAEAQGGGEIAPDRSLTLETCVSLAVQKNYAVQIQAYAAEQAKEAVEFAKGAFDPTLTASINRSFNQAATSINTLDGTAREGLRTDNTAMSFGLSQRLPQTNGTFSLTTNLARNATNSSFVTLNPAFGNGISANLSQPLLQNAGGKVATAALERARLGLKIANLSTRSSILSTIASVETAYYNLVATREALRIRQLSLELAQKLLGENQVRRLIGTMTDLDVLTAEAGAESARGAVLQAEKSARDAEEALLQVISVTDLGFRPGPVHFDNYIEEPLDFAAAYKLARENYPDLLASEETLKQLQVTLNAARRNQLPSVNLNATLGYTARTVGTGYSDALANLPKDHGNNWALGLTYSVPWDRRADRATFRSARAGVASQKVRIEQIELQLAASVRAAARAVETNLAAVSIAAKATELRTRQYELEKARFDAGVSTSRLVLQAQSDLETARFDELSAKLDLRRAASVLRQLTGSSLQHYRILSQD